MSSIVAEMRKRLELEAEGLARVFNEPSSVARHDIIQARHRAIGECAEQLIPELGEENTWDLIVMTIDSKVPSQL